MQRWADALNEFWKEVKEDLSGQRAAAEEAKNKLEATKKKATDLELLKTLLKKNGVIGIRFGKDRNKLQRLITTHNPTASRRWINDPPEWEEDIKEWLATEHEFWRRVAAGEDEEDVKNDFEFRQYKEDNPHYFFQEKEAKTHKRKRSNGTNDSAQEDFQFKGDKTDPHHMAFADAYAQLAYAIRKKDAARVKELLAHIETLKSRRR